MIDNVNAIHDDLVEVELDRLQPLQGMIDREDDDMGQLENQHPPNQQPHQQHRQQVMSPKERERQQPLQAYALQDRPNAFECPAASHSCFRATSSVKYAVGKSPRCDPAVSTGSTPKSVGGSSGYEECDWKSFDHHIRKSKAKSNQDLNP